MTLELAEINNILNSGRELVGSLRGKTGSHSTEIRYGSFLPAAP